MLRAGGAGKSEREIALIDRVLYPALERQGRLLMRERQKRGPGDEL